MFHPTIANIMQLTLHTDYALRVLIYLSLKPSEMVTIDEITDYYGVSRNHLVKVVHHLATQGFIKTTRGKNGGMQLADKPEKITIGSVVRKMEANFDIVECFNDKNARCNVVPICNLKSVLQKASANFLSYLDQFSIADAVDADKQAGIVIPFIK
ncbi:MAG: Rrf2 family transcriptional regulator [Gammaproteobacteria bacterium]|nr:Rrf2 family transcriptional regulator [Gammaproteobacteria bacterium]MDH5803522.1 Rrf2 family transcriptional regulator [Gammaproteobacteria bacterium]